MTQVHKKTSRQDTRTELIRSAEQLFAEKGLGGVSVREITRAAGAKNESALHYHFGGMEPLIREVFAHRYRGIERARLDILASMDGELRGDIQALMHAAIAPMFEACQDENGRRYARFCVQLATDPRFNLDALTESIGMESVVEVDRLFRQALRDLPPDIVSLRLRRLFTLSLLLAADHVKQLEAGTGQSLEAAIGEAVESLGGFLCGPARQ
jgi:AcrR family transcriptional regulator